MDWFLALTYAVVTGLTACGIAASILELVMQRQVRFAEPFVSAAHLPRSAAVLILAGPFMLGNDALAAFRNGTVSGSALLACAGAALLWAGACGVVVLAAAAGLAAMLL